MRDPRRLDDPAPEDEAAPSPPPPPAGQPSAPGADPASLLRGLNGAVRGLSALVWGLPISLLIVVWTLSRSSSSIPSPLSELLQSMGVAPALFAAVLLWYGVWQLGRFQPEHVGWQRTVDRARGLAWLQIGLAPFLYWWSRMPEVLYFKITAIALIVFSLLFLAQLNTLLRRLTAMLPDQALRSETSSMASMNYGILAVLGGLHVVLYALDRVNFESAVSWVAHQYIWLARLLLLLFMVMPIAITMAVMWKIKETILESVFSSERW